MTRAPYFSIVIPSRNRPGLLMRALASVRAQNCADCETIVVNDASTEDYSNVVQAFGDHVSYVERETQGGVAAARNDGIRIARGRWVVFLDDDDEWLPGFLRQQEQVLKAAPAGVGFAWCSSFHQRYDRAGRVVASWARRHQASRLTEDELCALASCTGAGCGFTVQRRLLDALGGFDERLTIGEDTELVLRLLSRGHSPVLNEEVGVIVHEHSGPRLAGSEGLYAQLRVHEGLIERYRGYLISRPALWAKFVSTAAVLHYRNRDVERGDELLEVMLQLKHPRVWRRFVQLRWNIGARERSSALVSSSKPNAVQGE